MIIEIDINSGFCFGVVYAIEKAEMYLNSHQKLYCLGDIVHNDEEIKRLESLGLQIINYDKFKNINTEKVLFRAHGEHPNNYKIAFENNIDVIDASCPIVLRLQMNIRKKYLEIKDKNGQIVIFGKKGHAEVIALSGHACNQAIIVSNIDDLNLIDFNRPIAIFSQTTKSNFEYKKIVDEIKKRIKIDDFYFQDSVCKQVSNRDSDLRIFAKRHELVIFVSGKKSSNGKFLYDICSNENKNSFFISDETELKKEWFFNVNKVGITGATSTPMWLMEKIKSFIEKQFILL
jgi:4-hydroxy-3-methylbut-2-enyl diphosphate reductase